MMKFNICSAVFLSSLFIQTAISQDLSSWYAFQPVDTVEQGEIGMADWHHRPAGQFGRVEMKDGDLVIDDAPIKLWGVNNTYATCAPEKELAEQRAAWYAKMGFNSMRLHKYADGPGWRGICSDESFILMAKKIKPHTI